MKKIYKMHYIENTQDRVHIAIRAIEVETQT